MKMLFLALFVVTASYDEQPTIVLNDHIQYMELVVGTGETAEAGKIAVIHFTGWLDDSGKKGDMIFNSREHGKPVIFKIGTDMVIEAWNLGVVGMKVGGIRRVMSDSELSYGAKGSGDVIPPYSDLIFEIELIKVK